MMIFGKIWPCPHPTEMQKNRVFALCLSLLISQTPLKLTILLMYRGSAKKIEYNYKKDLYIYAVLWPVLNAISIP